MNDEQIHAMSVLLVAASGRQTPLTMAAAEEMLREIVSLPRGPFVQPEPVAVRYRNGGGRWRYLNYPFTKGWTFPQNLGTPIPLYDRASGVQGTLNDQPKGGA